MPNPKLEFFRFKLNHKSGKKKTFREFMLENGKATLRQKDNTIFANLYKYFMEQPKNGFAKNDSLKKVVTLIGNRGRKKINKHFGERPLPNIAKCIISGVINGGAFGKDRILSNLDKKESSENILASQPVLQYYYIFLYLPLDHNEGFFMVHSDSSDESITQAMRKYIGELFNLGNYNKPNMSIYVPKYFRDEYKDGAILKSITFYMTELSADMDDEDPLKDIAGEFDVKISLSPKGKTKADLKQMISLRNLFAKNRFGTESYNRSLDEFDKCTVSTKNEDVNSTKIFDWNNRDQELQPAVYLRDRVAMEDDNTPNFAALDTFCHQLFKDYILHELRPDKDVKRVD